MTIIIMLYDYLIVMNNVIIIMLMMVKHVWFILLSYLCTFNNLKKWKTKKIIIKKTINNWIHENGMECIGRAR
jgi:hypothetical protein